MTTVRMLPMEPDQGDGTCGEQLAWVKLSFPFIERNPIGARMMTRPACRRAIIPQNIDPNQPQLREVIDPNNDNNGADDYPTWTFG